MPCARGGRRPLAIKEMTNEPAAHAMRLLRKGSSPDGRDPKGLGAKPRARSGHRPGAPYFLFYLFSEGELRSRLDMTRRIGHVAAPKAA